MEGVISEEVTAERGDPGRVCRVRKEDEERGACKGDSGGVAEREEETGRTVESHNPARSFQMTSTANQPAKFKTLWSALLRDGPTGLGQVCSTCLAEGTVPREGTVAART